MSQTDQQFDQVAAICRDIFTKKMKDYGASWRILRQQSVTDQIFKKEQAAHLLFLFFKGLLIFPFVALFFCAGNFLSTFNFVSLGFSSVVVAFVFLHTFRFCC